MGSPGKTVLLSVIPGGKVGKIQIQKLLFCFLLMFQKMKEET